MSTLNTILKELKDVPLNRLEDLYTYIHSLKSTNSQSDTKRKKILSFAGSFDAMTQEEYEDFLKETRKTRIELFDRDINL